MVIRLWRDAPPNYFPVQNYAYHPHSTDPNAGMVCRAALLVNTFPATPFCFIHSDSLIIFDEDSSVIRL